MLLFNRWLAPLLPHFCLTVILVARPKPEPSPANHCILFRRHPRAQ